MLSLVKDVCASAALRVRYQKLARQRLLELLESHHQPPQSESDGYWHPLNVGGERKPPNPDDQADLRKSARRLVAENPYARNVIRLLEAYVVGPECHVSARAGKLTSSRRLAQTADRTWDEFLETNARHFSFRELARRTWRDGESFLRLFPTPDGPPAVRFLDPETIGPTPEHPDSAGILTDPHDSETPRFYLHIDPVDGRLIEKIPAAEILHTKIGADSNEPRGTSFLASLISPLEQYERWLEIEMIARKLQASVVLWRKVADGPLGGFGSNPNDDFDLFEAEPERFLPGTIMTTNQAVDLQFLQPPAGIKDSAPLGRMMLLAVAAAAGMPEYMLTGDASNANYSSTMIAEGPAVKLFQSEQRFFAAELSRLWHFVMADAAARNVLPADFLKNANLEWTFPTLVARDRPRERYADAQLIQSGVLSRAEVARRENVDPALMRAELAAERHRETNGRQVLADQ